jgi:CrcB protein
MARAIILVMTGGAIGAAIRYLISHYFSNLSQHHGFPFGTLLVNVIGSFAVGYILTWTSDHGDDRWRLLLATGFCGGFTTFSTFAYESMAYWHDSRFFLLALNVALNNTLSFCAVMLGIQLHKSR